MLLSEDSEVNDLYFKVYYEWQLATYSFLE